MSIIQQIPEITPTSRYTTIIPLMIVLLISAFQEVYEDLERRNQDQIVNDRPTQILDLALAKFTSEKAQNVKVGDLIQIEDGKILPADIVVLHSSEPNGLCYLETGNLDGETNLKLRQGVFDTCTTTNDLASLRGIVTGQRTGTDLSGFEGRVFVHEQTIPIGPAHLLPRGSTLKNTKWVHGIVIYTGADTNLTLTKTTRIKKTLMAKQIDRFIMVLLGALIVLSVLSTFGSLYCLGRFHNEYTYLEMDNQSSVVFQFCKGFLTFLILYNNLIPISLIITLEAIRLQKAALINNDLDMYDIRTNTTATARAPGIIEELGQIEYIFTDKTGTLTENIMVLQHCIVAGHLYADLQSRDGINRIKADAKMTSETGFEYSQADLLTRWDIPHDNIVRFFLTILAVCHTVIPENPAERENDISYHASSPDEGALVKATSLFGFKFVDRKPESVLIQLYDDFEHIEEYKVLNILEFSSSRRRMSVIVQSPQDRIFLFIKGASSVVMDLLSKDDAVGVEKTAYLLEKVANEGLRILCIAFRELSKDEYLEWNVRYEKAKGLSFRRGEEISKISAMVEQDLHLIGATAIEDKLQPGVTETIQLLTRAGIKFWMITGDQQETAVNVGFSTRMLDSDTNLVVLDGAGKELENLIQSRIGMGPKNTGLIVSGKILAQILNQNLEPIFFKLACSCRAVICCRACPFQKAWIVERFKAHSKSVVLAVGDGENDVEMLREANIGVGISGNENLQAYRSSDLSISRFRHLQKLLLVHGLWAYQRLSKVVLFSFYKNMVLYFTQFLFIFSNLFSGQTLYESWILSLYNVVFTFFPPIILGITDKHSSQRQNYNYPELYRLGSTHEFFNWRRFASTIANAIYHSVVIYLLVGMVCKNGVVLKDGRLGGHWFVGTTMYTAVLITVLLKAALISNSWTWYSFLCIFGSLGLWFAFVPTYDTIAINVWGSGEIVGVSGELYSNPVFWLTICIVPLVCLYTDFTWKYLKRQYLPADYHIIQEIGKYNLPDYRPKQIWFDKGVEKVQTIVRNRGYPETCH